MNFFINILFCLTLYTKEVYPSTFLVTSDGKYPISDQACPFDKFCSYVIQKSKLSIWRLNALTNVFNQVIENLFQQDLKDLQLLLEQDSMREMQPAVVIARPPPPVRPPPARTPPSSPSESSRSSNSGEANTGTTTTTTYIPMIVWYGHVLQPIQENQCQVINACLLVQDAASQAFVIWNQTFSFQNHDLTMDPQNKKTLEYILGNISVMCSSSLSLIPSFFLILMSSLF